MSLPEHIREATKVEPETQLNANSQKDTERTGLIGVKSKFNEDVLSGNHQSVWGSFFCTETKKWGFKCCKVTDKTN